MSAGRDFLIEAAAERALGYFAVGYNWAQSVLLAVCKEMDGDCDCIPRIGAGLGGGLGRQEEVCGACAAGVLLVGLLYGSDGPDDAEAKATVKLKRAEFVQRFADLNGAIRCRDLIGLDLTGEEAAEEYHALNLREEVCSGAVSSAVRAFLELR